MISVEQSYNHLPPGPLSMNKDDIFQRAQTAYSFGKANKLINPDNSTQKTILFSGYMYYWQMGRSGEPFKFEE